MWYYGMRLRGFSPGCQPKEGFLQRFDDFSGKYWDILEYSRPLTETELSDYELDEIKENNLWGQTEVCPFCESESFHPFYDAEKRGYITKCSVCGREIFLCDACLHADDNNQEQKCDWKETGRVCKCFRGTIIR